MTSSTPLTVVLHIPKTAGQTLGRQFAAHLQPAEWAALYPPAPPGTVAVDDEIGDELRAWVAEHLADKNTEHLRVLFGHWAYWGVHQLLPNASEARFATFFREPVDRVISLYFYSMRKTDSFLWREVTENNWTIEQWWEKSRNIRRLNGQLRHLLLDDPTIRSRALTQADLDEGLRRVEQMWFVGLTETFESDASFLRGELGFAPHAPGAAINVGTNREPVSESLRQKMAQELAFDYEIYRAAQKRHARLREQNAEKWANYEARDAAAARKRQRQEKVLRPLRSLKKKLRR